MDWWLPTYHQWVPPSVSSPWSTKSEGNELNARDGSNVCPPSPDHVQCVWMREPMQSVAVRRSYHVTWTRPLSSTATAGKALSKPGGSSFTRTLGNQVAPPSAEAAITTSRWSRATDSDPI